MRCKTRATFQINTGFLSSMSKNGISPMVIPTKADIWIEVIHKSFDCASAFCRYVAASEVVEEIEKQNAYKKDTLDARNEEERKRTEILVRNHVKQLEAYVNAEKEKMDMQYEQDKQKTTFAVNQFAHGREEKQRVFQIFKVYIEPYEDYLNEINKQIQALQKMLYRGDEEYEQKLNELQEDFRININYVHKFIREYMGEK